MTIEVLEFGGCWGGDRGLWAQAIEHSQGCVDRVSKPCLLWRKGLWDSPALLGWKKQLMENQPIIWTQPPPNNALLDTVSAPFPRGGNRSGRSYEIFWPGFGRIWTACSKGVRFIRILFKQAPDADLYSLFTAFDVQQCYSKCGLPLAALKYLGSVKSVNSWAPFQTY